MAPPASIAAPIATINLAPIMFILMLFNIVSVRMA
jgi:hypothetical protein